MINKVDCALCRKENRLHLFYDKTYDFVCVFKLKKPKHDTGLGIVVMLDGKTEVARLLVIPNDSSIKMKFESKTVSVLVASPTTIGLN